MLLPPSTDDWLAEDHPSRFVAEAVDELLDLAPIYASYESFDGAPPYDPTMMRKLLLWGYSCGVTSSREMERPCGTDVAFRYLCANQAPDYGSIARFGHEDEAFGADRRGDELPAELARRETRLEKMRASKEAIEHDAKEKAAAKARAKAEKEARSDDEVQEAVAVAAEKATPDKAAQRNFTDPECRMMKTNDGFHYADNGQAVVDEEAQVILAVSVTQAAGDVGQLFSMADRMADNLASAGIEGGPDVMLADAGCCSEDNLNKAHGSDLDWLIATGRLKHHERVPAAPRGRIRKDATSRERMARRLRTKAGRTDYARRKAIVEPAFGQMKVHQHAGHLRLRGLDGATGEWTLHAICHNLRKLGNRRAATAAMA